MTKRVFDVLLAFLLINLVVLPLLFFFFLSCKDTQKWGVFKQLRIGQFGQPFVIYKLRTLHIVTNQISYIGRLMRRYRFDELPQLINILKGDMSFVGPRPDTPGYYNSLEGEQRKLLNLKPGLTCEASLKYWNEEAILSQQVDPKFYNDTVIFPDKVRMNLQYYYNRSFLGDLKIIFKTLVMLVSLVIGKTYLK